MREEKRLVPKRRLGSYSETWVEKEFNNLGSFGKTYSFSRSKEGVGKYHHIHYGDIHTKNYGVINKNSILPMIKEEGAFELLKQGDIVIADASEDYKDLGKVTVIGETANRKIIAGLHTFKFTPNENLCPIYYLYYSQTRTFKRFSYKTGTGISVFGITKDNLGKMKLFIPTYQEQQKIGKFFKLLDERIANQERKIAKVKALKSAYLTEMFPQEGETVPKRRFNGFEGDWKEKLLGELASINTGDSDVKDSVTDGKYPFFIRSKNIERSDTYTFEGEAILIPGEGKLGEILHYYNGKFNYHQRVYKTSNFNEDIDGRFIYYTMSHTFKKHALKETVKATVDSLRLPTLTSYRLLVPTVKEQQKIGQFFKNLDDQITTEEKKLEKLKKMKEAYLEEMFV